MANVSSSNGLEKYPKLRFKGFSGPWTQVLLSDIFKKSTKKNSDGSVTNVICNSAKNGLIPQREYFDKSIANSDNTNGYYIIEQGDFVYNPRKSSDAPYGPVSIYKYPESGIVSPLYLCFRALKPINSSFYDYFFKSPSWHRYIYLSGDSGARHDRVSIKDDVFFSMPVHIPSEEEQLKVSTFLSLIEKRIVDQQQLVEHLKKYKRGFLQASFSSQDDWNTYPISSLGKVVTGSTPPTDNPENYGGDELFCAPSDVGAEKYISSTIKRVSEKGFHTGRIVPKGTIIVTCIGLIGKLGIATQDMITNQQINSLIVNDAFDNEFIYYALEFALPRYAAQASMQTMPILSKSEFEKITLQIPNIKRQKEISQPLALLDNKIATQALVLENLIALKNGLLQKLFI